MAKCALHISPLLKENKMREFKEYNSCTLCPRMCKANRNAGKTGFCNQTSKLKIARASLHFWEEPCISGEKGSGTVFFSGCSLKCVFCQNYEISSQNSGKITDEERLAGIFTELYEKGAENINLVTGEHFVPHITSAIKKAKTRGVSIPFIFNTSGYIGLESLKKLEGLIDVYLPDFKYINPETAKKYSHAENYPYIIKVAIDEMVRQCPEIVMEKGLIKKGVIVRQLCLPGHTEESKEIIRYLFQKYGESIILSIMNQYTPLKNVQKHPEINRKLTQEEYDSILDYCLQIGVENAYIQEDGTVDESFIPDFNGKGV